MLSLEFWTYSFLINRLKYICKSDYSVTVHKLFNIYWIFSLNTVAKKYL